MLDAGSKSDPELVRLVQQGSEAALEALYQRYLRSVWRYVYAQLRGDQQAAEDVVSETFLAAIRGLRKLDPDGGSVHAWLMGIARHKLADHWRRARRLREDPHADTEDMGPSEAVDPQEALESAESNARVTKAMTGLPDEQRLALEWKYLDGLTVRQMADRIGRTDKAVEALLYRARRSFRAVFEGLQQRQS